LGCGSRFRIEFVLDQTDRYICISAIPQSAADLPQGANQLATLANARLRKQDSEGFLKSPAPNPSIVNRIRMIVNQHFREQGDKLFQAPLCDSNELLVTGGGFNRMGICFTHGRLTALV
jgi:hypothetical protein